MIQTILYKKDIKTQQVVHSTNCTIEQLVHNSTSDANRPNSQINEIWLQNKIMSTSNHAAQWKNREDVRLVQHICTNCTGIKYEWCIPQ